MGEPGQFGTEMNKQFVRYSYWVIPEKFPRIAEELESRFDTYMAQKVPCEPLGRNIEVGFVLPEVWSLLCKRQGSWYRAAPRAGQIVVVSSVELDEYGLELETVIRDSDFRPPELPALPQRIHLVRSGRYSSMRPPEWERVSEEEKNGIVRQARTLGIRDSIDDILLSRSANHANFLYPRYYVRKDSEIIPYSISRSGNVCSSCLEFFNVIGGEFRTKMVVPCVGAVLYAGMRANRYYEVKSMAADD